jgi:hypothetical protein
MLIMLCPQMRRVAKEKCECLFEDESIIMLYKWPVQMQAFAKWKARGTVVQLMIANKTGRP